VEGPALLKPRRIFKKVSEFVCLDGEGGEHVVIEYQDCFENRLLNGRVKWLAGLKDFRLQNGLPLYKTGDQTFVIVATGLKIRRTNPAEGLSLSPQSTTNDSPLRGS
jgi:hypothetical protein